MNKYLNLLYSGDYDQLVEQTFPVLENDNDAELAFLRMCQSKNILFILDDRQNIINLFLAEAEKGNRYAQYAYARWQCLTRRQKDSLSISYRHMKAAAEQQLPDAIAGLAMVYEYGDTGVVDWEKADELLRQSIEMGSELGRIYHLQNLCFGRHFQNNEPEEAAKLAEQYIAEDEAKGIAPNGWWYYYLATAKEDRIGRSRLIDEYLRAAELGVIAAYTDLALAYGYGDEGNVLIESKDYIATIEQGLAHRCAGVFYLDACREIKRCEVYEETDQIPASYHERIQSRLNEAAKLGDSGAWELLGDLYKDGDNGFEQSYKQAFDCYSNGAMHDHLASIEKQWKMMHDHLIDRPLDYIDSVALQGARNGSKRLLAETVIACQEGRLTDYKHEVEKYYDPIFDSPDFSLDNDEDWMGVLDEMMDDDEPLDDDGRFDPWA